MAIDTATKPLRQVDTPFVAKRGNGLARRGIQADQVRERQREGIAIAKREGKYRGRKPSLTPARAAELRRRVADGDSKAALAREFDISRDTLYRYVPVKKRRAGKIAK